MYIKQAFIFKFTQHIIQYSPILWPPYLKSWLIGKDSDAGKDWRQEEKGTTEDEMAGWHHRLNRREFEHASGDSKGKGSLMCCSPWGCKESNMTEWLNTKKNKIFYILQHEHWIDFFILVRALNMRSAAAAAAAKSLQLCPTLCKPIDGSPPASPIPGILQARTVE